MLDLKLHPDARFMHEALTNCKATVELAPETGTAAIALKGVFRIMNTGNAADCVITARGELNGEDPIEVEEPSAIKATLTANFKRTVKFVNGSADTGIVLPDGTTDEFTGKVKVAGADPELAAKDNGEGAPKTLLVNVADLKDKEEVEFIGMTVATGEGRDPNCNGPFMINQVGEVHLDAVCGWARYRDLKPNPTHLRIRGVNSHAKIYTLGVKDATHTAHTCGE
jgi:hypothetical protein